MKLKRHKRNWTKRDDEDLKNAWSDFSLETVAERLGRTKDAVTVRAKRLGLGSAYQNDITASEVARMLGIACPKNVIRWKNKGLKMKHNGTKSPWRIGYDNLINFLKNNQDLWDSRNMELYALGHEPKWLIEKRRTDMSMPGMHKQKWTEREDSLLISYYNMDRSIEDIADVLQRTVRGIGRRISRLKKSGELVMDKINIPWTVQEVDKMLQMEVEGKSDLEIAWELGREEMHIQDKRRKMRANGEYEGLKRYRKNARSEFIEKAGSM